MNVDTSHCLETSRIWVRQQNMAEALVVICVLDHYISGSGLNIPVIKPATTTITTGQSCKCLFLVTNT